MFEGLPDSASRAAMADTEIDDAISAWTAALASASAHRLLFIGEKTARNYNDDWEILEDTDAAWNSAAAEISAASGISHGRASSDMEIGAALCTRLPQIAALLLAGRISEFLVRRVVHRTANIGDPDLLARVEADLVERVVHWGALSLAKLDAAIDVWVDRHDPGALRRTRVRVRDRGVDIVETKNGVTEIVLRLKGADAALYLRRLTVMAHGVCNEDPRTLDQRRADAHGAIGAGFFHLACECGAPACDAAGDDGRASHVTVTIYAPTDTLTAAPDPFMDGDGPLPDDPPRAPKNTVPAPPTPKADSMGAEQDSDAGVNGTRPDATAKGEGEESSVGDAAAESDRSDGAGAEQDADAEAVVEDDVAAEATPDQRECVGPAAARDSVEDATAEPVQAEPIVGAQNSDKLVTETEAQAGTEAEGDLVADVPLNQRDCDGLATEPKHIDVVVTAQNSATAPEQPTAALRPPPGILPGFGGVPAPLLVALLARGAKLRYLTPPGIDPEDTHRASTGLDDWVRARDMTCRFPNCDRPAAFCDWDHTVPWPAGPTHASGGKLLCRLHHMGKTFWLGWSDVQHPDGTIVWTTPTGQTYTTKPGSSLFYPTVNTTSAPIATGTPIPNSPDKILKMPRRKRNRARERGYRINAERALNDAHVADRNQPPPF